MPTEEERRAEIVKRMTFTAEEWATAFARMVTAAKSMESSLHRWCDNMQAMPAKPER